MNERETSRRLSSSVVETLKGQGHILVVKGGAQALARELDELMAPTLALIGPRLSRGGVVTGEVTSTFGDETVDEAVEEVVAKMTRALMDSDHVEDVFAEDNVIQRDVFRAVRDGLMRGGEAEVEADDAPEEATVKVRLDTLGYVASTVSKRADPKTLRETLEQAAALVEAELVSFVTETREATFSMPDAGPDGRLDLEESVADELTALVEDGTVELPTIERRVDVGRDVPEAEQLRERQRIEVIAEKTLHRSGCAASWDFVDARTLRITLTPLSEQDSRDVDQPVALFARGAASLFAAAPSAAAPATAEAAAPTSERPRSSRRGAVAALKVDHPTPPSDPPPAKKPAKKAAPAAKKPAAKKAAAKPATKPAAKPAAKKPAAKKK